MSDEEADSVDAQYLQIDHLPELRLSLEPLSYEQARVFTYLGNDGFYLPNEDEAAALAELNTSDLISIGGCRYAVTNAGGLVCHNPKCRCFNLGSTPIYFALVPSFEINGSSEFWHEYDADVTFYFAWCWHCRTIYSSNACT
ncbi:MAG: hypothetical protein MI861_20510 [Pirellulales bacterium]|nr:hypothetical protein [Pirellulales bacterium]